jgi:hypothetical protein
MNLPSPRSCSLHKLLAALVATIVLAAAPAVVSAKGGGGGGGGGPGGGGGTSNTPAPYVDPVNKYLSLYDTNHDGRLEADELKKMAILDPAAYQQAMAFADSRGQLGIDELNQWRAFLKAQSQAQSPSNKGGQG